MKFERKAWSQEAEQGLRDTFFSEPGFDAVAHVRNLVQAGYAELWHINGNSWAVTQTWQDIMFLWCYQGKRLLEFTTIMVAQARANRLARLRFGTHHKALVRMLRRFNPREVQPEIYEIGVN